jgi:hypothetical protein
MALESLSSAIARLEARGFRHSLRARRGVLRIVETDETLDPEKLRVDEIVRFEGETDPAEELVLFALRGPDGAPLGTYATMFGPATPPDDAAVVRRLGGSWRRLAVDADPPVGRC